MSLDAGSVTRFDDLPGQFVGGVDGFEGVVKRNLVAGDVAFMFITGKSILQSARVLLLEFGHKGLG